MASTAPSPLNRVFGAIIPRAVDALDPDELIERVDLDAVLGRVDLNLVLDRLDPDAVLARIDVNALMDRIDVNALMTRVDIESLLNQVDVNAMIQRVDTNALMANIDVNALMTRVDIEALLNQVDVNAMVQRVDVNAMVDQVDLVAVMSRAGIDQIVADATSGMATRALDLARRQILGFDLLICRFFDRIMGRRAASPALPRSITAGPIARILAFMIDSVAVSGLFGLGMSLAGYLIGLFTSWHFDPEDTTGTLWLAVFLVWWFAYLWVSITVSGRTLGKGLLGLRVVAIDGSPLSPTRVAIRTLCLPFSLILGIGLIPAVLGRNRRAAHDFAAGSVEVVDWGNREVTPPSRITTFLTAA